MTADASSFRHLVDQAARCLERADETGAEVHLTAALELTKTARDEDGAALVLIALGSLRERQRRGAAAERLWREALAIQERRGDHGEAEKTRALLRLVSPID